MDLYLQWTTSLSGQLIASQVKYVCIHVCVCMSVCLCMYVCMCMCVYITTYIIAILKTSDLDWRLKGMQTEIKEMVLKYVSVIKNENIS